MDSRSWVCVVAAAVFICPLALGQESKSNLAVLRAMRLKQTSLTAEEQQQLDGAIKKIVGNIEKAQTVSAINEVVKELKKLLVDARGRDFRQKGLRSLIQTCKPLMDAEVPKDPEKAKGYVARVVGVTSVVAQMLDPQAIRFLAEAGKHRIQAVRYWAVQGLASLVRTNVTGGDSGVVRRACEALANIGLRTDNSPAVLRTVYRGLDAEGEPVAAKALLRVLDGRLKLYASGNTRDMSVEVVALDIVGRMIPPMIQQHNAFMKVLIPLLRYVADEYVMAYAAYDDWKAKNVPKSTDEKDNRQRQFTNPFKVRPEDLDRIKASPVAVNDFNRVQTRIRTAVLVLDSLARAMLAIMDAPQTKQADDLRKVAATGDPDQVLKVVDYWIGPQGVLPDKYRVPVPQPAQIAPRARKQPTSKPTTGPAPTE